jgi:5-methylcytosine-specific restriction endonuclease McrBC regulatory subunit McrC
MPSLFESFVAEWLREKMPLEFKVKNQYILNFDPFEFRIDIVIVDAVTGENLCVLDTKYKTGLKPEDFNQVAIYASAIKTKNAF